VQEGILNEPVRESADALIKNFGDQMGIPFTNLMFIAVGADGTFRTANYAKDTVLTKEAVKMIAKHLELWANQFDD